MNDKNEKKTTPKSERKNEPNYRSMFTDILASNTGILSTELKNAKNPEQYETERNLITKAIASERNAFMSGVAVGALAFVSFRYLPAYIIKRIGSKEKVKKFLEAEEAANKEKFGWARRGVALVFEGLFASWAGVRAYYVSSKGSDDIYEEIAKIPLSDGRSVISDKMCQQWVDTAYRQIPREFWFNLKEEKLNDNRTWRAIGQFAQNCVMRDLYETKIRTEKGLPPDEPVLIPSPGVPTPNQGQDENLTIETAEMLVTDNACN
mmetsp:Transcript_14294/g.18035  ORF Transcript_14294/g.18035 Transcript_14294/m.18035 type:complete len:264 (+) Transcript_14294:49-840(+)